MTIKTDDRTLRIWALTGARAGDNDQVIALAEALGRPFEIKELQYNHLQLLGPRLLGRSLISLTRGSREDLLREQLPDLLISTGHRSVPVSKALRHRSGGRTRSIHVGFPRVSPGNFDLVIATPQYPINDHPNLLKVPYALTTAATAKAEKSGDTVLERLPRPRRMLIIGGPNLYWKIDQAELRQILRDMLGEAGASGGSVLVTTSPRTPAALLTLIKCMLGSTDVPCVFAIPGGVPDYPKLLAAADSVHITADSVAMVSDAIWTGAPIALVRVAPTLLGRIAMPIMDWLRPGMPIYPQDLRFFWRALSKIGVTGHLGVPATSRDEELRAVLGRILPILDELRVGPTC